MFFSKHLWFLLFINVVNGFFADNNFNHNLRLCTDIVKGFMHGQESVNVFKSSKSINYDENEIIKTFQTVSPVLVYEENNEVLVEKIHDMGDELNVPSVTKSFLAMSESTEFISSNLNFFSHEPTENGFSFLFKLSYLKL